MLETWLGIFGDQVFLAVLRFIAPGFFLIAILLWGLGKYRARVRREKQLNLQMLDAQSRLADDVVVAPPPQPTPAPIPTGPVDLDAPLMPMVASRPSDRRYFAAVRKHADEKAARGMYLNEHERIAQSFLPLVLKSTKVGFAEALAPFKESLPFKGWELRQALETIGLPQHGAQIDEALKVYWHRMQLIADMTATGMPLPQALAHKDLPSYDTIDAWFSANGGGAQIETAADTYFGQHYPFS